MIDTLKILCRLSGVSGSEDEVRDYILDRVKQQADDISTDVMGNVFVLKKGAIAPAKKLILCAHMDEVGVIITNITDDGHLKFAMSGGVDRRVIIGKTVFIGKQKVFGVIGNKAIHLVKEKDRENAPETEELCIDIGAKNREAAEKLVELGETAVFDSDFREFGSGFVKAKAIDDRFGCAVLLKLIESELPIDCGFVFTVQEEVGVRGAYAAAFHTSPDIALVVDTTSAADLPSVPESKKVCKAGGGAVIPFMDGGTIYDRELYGILTVLADKNDIPWQTKNVIAGGTDGAAFQRSRSGARTAGMAAPVRNLHSPSCVAKISDMEAVYKLAQAFIDEIGKRFN